MGMLLRRYHEVNSIQENPKTVGPVEETQPVLVVEEPTVVEAEKPKYKKWEITHMTTAEVTKVAKSEGMDIKDLSGAKIKEQLIKHLGL